MLFELALLAAIALPGTIALAVATTGHGWIIAAIVLASFLAGKLRGRRERAEDQKIPF